MKPTMSRFLARYSCLAGIVAVSATTGCTGYVGVSADDEPTTTDGRGSARAGNGGGSGAGQRGDIFGEAGQPGTGGAPDNPDVAFACDPSAVPATTPMRKLTGTQYRNTLADLLKLSLKDDALVSAVMSDATVTAAISEVPKDVAATVPTDKYGTFRQLDQDVLPTHIESGFKVAVAVGAAIATVPARLGAIAGACATDANAGNDAPCMGDFVTRFGERALRRPLDAAEATFYKGVFGTGGPKGWGDLIGAFLTAPQFLYVVEHGTDGVSGKTDVYKLSDFELASRLSYHFWQTMPDDALFAAAKSGTLSQPAVYQMHVERLAMDSRARATMDEFFYDYFKLFPSAIRDLTKLNIKANDATYKAFAGADLPTAELGRNMANELVDMARYFTWEKGGKFVDLLTNEHSFAKTSDLAKIYGLAPWNGSGEPPKFPAGQRPGFLTRAAFLSTGILMSRPIIKGVTIREHVLCDHVPAPPNNAAVNSNLDTSNQTTRQAVEAITEQTGTACASCHKLLINPLGFPTESFDSLGRHRTVEKIFDATGKMLREIPVDTRSQPQVVAGDKTAVDGAAGMVDLVVKSGKAQACFARNYFRFSFARMESEAADGCSLERLRDRTQNGSLADVLREAALLPAFTTRHMQ